MVWAQGVLLLVMTGIYLVQEFRLRRGSEGRSGVLDHLRWPMVAVPIGLYALTLILFSLGGLRGLSLTSALTCAVLPFLMGAVSASRLPDRPLGWHVGVAAACSLLALTVIAVGASAGS